MNLSVVIFGELSMPEASKSYLLANFILNDTMEIPVSVCAWTNLIESGYSGRMWPYMKGQLGSQGLPIWAWEL